MRQIGNYIKPNMKGRIELLHRIKTMYKYEVGKVLEGARGKQDCVIFDITDSGAILLNYLFMPTQNEIENIKNGQATFKLFEMDNIIFLLVKFGGLPFVDAPFFDLRHYFGLWYSLI